MIKSCFIVLGILLLTSMAITNQVEATQPMYLSLEQKDYNVVVGETIILNATLRIAQIGICKLEVYGDYIKNENWDRSFLQTLSSFSLNNISALQYSLKVPSTAYNKIYSIALIGKFNSELVWHTDIWFNVTNGQPWDSTRTIYNHTGMQIMADNCPRDLYLPEVPFQIKTWFNVSESGTYYIDSWLVNSEGSPSGIQDYPLSLVANQTYEYNSLGWKWNFQYTGGIAYVTFNLKTSDGGVPIESLVIPVQCHCFGDPDVLPITEDTKIFGDINVDKTVDIYDALLLASCYNLGLGNTNWNQATDLNNDNATDIFDAIILANNYGVEA